ncbi:MULTISPECIES: helix-turn-helix domain-containing protein [Citricoccus]|uniref:AraC-like ligand-binding domain-containing protein n=1 Tax=Citricoccus TaxID=169133 RepID=UPI000255DF20|nr:helix-turn-helix domain-containing protein [Citricoccus sp. CH26A]
MYQQDTASDFVQWRRLVSESFVPLAAEQVRPGPFTGHLAGRHLRELAIMRVQAGSHAVLRTPELIGQAGPGYYKLSLQVSGHGLLVQDGRETLLQPGDLAIYDTERPYSLSFDEEFSTLVLMFPRQLAGLSTDDVRELTATTMGAGHRLGQAVAPFITQIGAMLPTLDGPIGHRLALNVVDLLATVMADELYSRQEADSTQQSRLLRRIHHFIESQLANPDLGPDMIAAAHYISTRALHQLFATTDHTVARWIRERRLEQCRRDLQDPLHRDVPVAAVGARWGLADPAHFSRVFRAEFGQSPAQYRRDHL